jgi:hypothetical protein
MTNSQLMLYLSGLGDQLKLLVNDPNYGDSNRKQLGFKLDSLYQRCLFNSRVCDIVNDFNWYFNYDYGNCYQFNSGSKFLPLKQTLFSG